MSTGRMLLRGSVLNLSEQVLRFVAVFVMTPIIIGSLGKESYGFWALLMSILGHYAYLDFGLSLTLSRFFGEAIGKNDDGRIDRIFNTALVIFLRIGGAGLLISAGVYFAVPLFVSDPETIRTARLICAIYGVYLSVGFPVRVFRSLLKGRLRFDLLVIASVIRIVITNVLIYIYLKDGYGLIALAVINAACGFLEYALITGAAYLSEKKMPAARGKYDVSLAKDLLRFSRVAFVTSLGSGLRSRVDPIVLGSFGLFSGITFYTVGTRFPVYLTDLVGAVMGGQLLAFLSQVYGKSGKADTVSRFITAMRISTVVAVFFGSALIVYGEAFIGRWMGEGFGASYTIMAILAVPYILQLMQYPCISLLYTLAKHKYIAITMISGGVANFILSVILAFQFGLFGVVWATVIEMTLVYSLVFPFLASKAGGIPLRKIYLHALGAPLLVCLGILVPFYWIAHSWIAPSYPRLILLGVIQAIVFVPLAARFVLNREERGLIGAAIFKRSRKGD